MSAISTNDKINRAVDAMEAGNIFSARSVICTETSSRRVSAILKSRIHCPENPKGDLRYENGLWMKLEPVNA